MQPALSTRPTLHRLNADSSWLLALPVPLVLHPSLQFPESTSWTLSLLIDPWFTGPQVDYHPRFSSQEHTTQSQFDDVVQLNAFLANGSAAVDAVLIAHEFSDHLHQATIESVDAPVPFMAVPRAAKILQSWGRKPEHVTEIPMGGGSLSFLVIPSSIPETQAVDFHTKAAALDLRLEYVGTTRSWYKDIAGARLHGCLVISFLASVTHVNSDSEIVREAIVYTPHGLPEEDFTRWRTTSRTGREIQHIVAVIAGWDEISNPPWLGGPLNLGLPHSVSLFPPLPAGNVRTRYFIRTHDELKTKGGLVGRVLKRKNWTREDVIRGLEGKLGVEAVETMEVLDMPVGDRLILRE